MRWFFRLFFAKMVCYLAWHGLSFRDIFSSSLLKQEKKRAGSECVCTVYYGKPLCKFVEAKRNAFAIMTTKKLREKKGTRGRKREKKGERERVREWERVEKLHSFATVCYAEVACRVLSAIFGVAVVAVAVVAASTYIFLLFWDFSAFVFCFFSPFFDGSEQCENWNDV